MLLNRFQAIRLATDRGDVQVRWYPAEDTQGGAIFVGGVGGGWDTPAQDMYPKLCEELSTRRIVCLRVRFRNATELNEATYDALAGVNFLAEEGVRDVALVGHSFGGAVVVRAAVAAENVKTVVTLATQSFGAEDVARLSPRCSILLLHGREDRVLPPEASVHLHAMAQEPKRLILYDKAGHRLDEVADEVRQEVGAWISAALKRL